MNSILRGTRERFADRHDAGRRLASALLGLRSLPNVVVLALPRGGVPVAYEIATALGAPLDTFEVRKLGLPGHEELGIGAIGSGGVIELDHQTIAALGVSRQDILAVIEREAHELERRERLYRDSRERPEVEGCTVIVVDDGLATGSTMRVAVAALRRKRPASIVVAVPVAPKNACRNLRFEADEVVCLESPEPFYGVGMWYGDFSQTSDDEVRRLLDNAASRLRTQEEPTDVEEIRSGN